MSIVNIPDVFKHDDTIYHYTTSENALLYILKDMQLRLSPRANSIDPIENTKDWMSYSDHTACELMGIGEKISVELDKGKQLSFCKNKPYDLSKGIPTVYPFEKYGFIKPRMWDNYGDKYKGVCLAFSKSKLKKAIKNTMLFDNEMGVEYLKYDELPLDHFSIKWQGTKEETFEYYLNAFKRRLFYKHEDYSMENEYRICSLSNKEYDYVDIQDSLIGLIVSKEGINEHLYEGFLQLLCNKAHIHFLIISFDNKAINIETYQAYRDWYKSIEDDLKKL